MWDLRIALPFGRLSIRKLLTVVTAMVVTTLAYIFLTASTTYAADANWSGAAITYNGNQYVAMPDAKAGDSTGLAPGTKVYAFTEPATSGSGAVQKAHLLYFPSGTDPSKATSAFYSVYDFTPPDKFSNSSPPATVTVTPSSGASGSSSSGTTSCDSTFTFGVGWIICPVTNFLSGAMDWLFGILSSFLVVHPVETGQNNALYRSWSVMRNFANIVFVIGFLFIIYSQITSLGLSNYGIKRMMPRLVIAAILVNVSYWICAIAIDLSNVLGYSLQELLISLRNSIVGNEGNGWHITSFKSIAGFVLSGGTAAVAGGIALYSLAAGAGGAIFLLLPILVGAILAVLVALLVMAARQAIITIMVIVAPLAFVAYLLPNTEKYFDKWKDLFLTMLIMFPGFSLVFGGAQLAGSAIIQNADSITTVLLGMAVQVAPVAITPLLLKLSGSLLGKFTGIVNNPKRGMVDRTRKWSQERADQHKARAIASGQGFMARRARNIDRRNRRREGWHKVNEAINDANWANTDASHDIHFASQRASLLKEVGETEAQARFEAAKLTSAELQGLDVNARAAKLRVDLSKARVDANWEEVKAGDIRSTIAPAGLSVAALANYMHDRNNLAQNLQQETIDTRVEAQRQRAAQHVQTQQFSNALDTNAALRQLAGGIDASGATKAHAAAVSELAKNQSEEVDAGLKLLNAQALKNGQTLKERSRIVVQAATSGPTAYSASEIEAALEAQALDGQIVNLENARMSANIDQDTLSRVFARNAGKLKEKGGFHLQDDPGLALAPLPLMQGKRATSLGDTAASNMKDLKVGWIKEVSNNIGDIIVNSNPADLQKAYNNVYEALTNDQIRATVGDRLEELQNIELALRNQGYLASPKTK